MAVSYNLGGRSRPISSTPADTNEATLFTAGPGNSVHGLYITNMTGTDANATVKWGDGSTDYAVINTETIHANAGLFEPEFYIPLRENYTIKITSDTADALTFTIIVLEGQSGTGHSIHQANV